MSATITPPQRPRQVSRGSLGPKRAGALADDLLSTMASIRRIGRRQSSRPVELATLTGGQLELVRLVRRRPNVSVAAAADELTLAPNTVSTLVRQLTRAGLLSRSDDPGDRRVARLELSDETRRRIDAWRDRRVLSLAQAISRLPARDQRLLERTVPLLQRLAQALDVEATDRPVSPARAR